MSLSVAVANLLEAAKSEGWDEGWEVGFDSALTMIERGLEGCLRPAEAGQLSRLIQSLR